jgi:hydroxypyruvate isomerase
MDVSGAAETFKLNYAPHDGMFANHAGKNFIDQIKFMHDQGFRAIEDNGLLGRPLEEQEKIGKELSRLGMTMGVFVVDGGENWQTGIQRQFCEHVQKVC